MAHDGAGAEVVYRDDEDDAAFAHLLGRLVEGNLAVRPEKRRDFDRLHGVIGFEATDIGESATLDFRGGSVAVGKGLEPGRAVTIRADSMTILELSNLRIGPLGLPVYVDSTGRSVVAKLARRELVIEGMTRHLALVNRLTRIFSVR